jgi:hypothetical protein
LRWSCVGLLGAQIDSVIVAEGDFLPATEPYLDPVRDRGVVDLAVTCGSAERADEPPVSTGNGSSDGYVVEAVHNASRLIATASLIPGTTVGAGV